MSKNLIKSEIGAFKKVVHYNFYNALGTKHILLQIKTWRKSHNKVAMSAFLLKTQTFTVWTKRGLNFSCEETELKRIFSFSKRSFWVSTPNIDLKPLKRAKHGGGSIMVCGCFSCYGVKMLHLPFFKQSKCPKVWLRWENIVNIPFSGVSGFFVLIFFIFDRMCSVPNAFVRMEIKAFSKILAFTHTF